MKLCLDCLKHILIVICFCMLIKLNVWPVGTANTCAQCCLPSLYHNPLTVNSLNVCCRDVHTSLWNSPRTHTRHAFPTHFIFINHEWWMIYLCLRWHRDLLTSETSIMTTNINVKSRINYLWVVCITRCLFLCNITFWTNWFNYKGTFLCSSCKTIHFLG